MHVATYVKASDVHHTSKMRIFLSLLAVISGLPSVVNVAANMGPKAQSIRGDYCENSC